MKKGRKKKEKEIEVENMYEIERFIDRRVQGPDGVSDIWYEVKWKGYKETTWEPEANVAHMTDMLYDFTRKLAKEERDKREEEKRR